MTRPRVVVVLPAYNAARTLERTVAEIPPGIVDELLLVDDASSDATVEVARRLGIRTEVHASNRGYGGNQKTCYRLALDAGADVVVMLHPDYQYDPALIPAMVERIAAGDCDVVLGSRVLDGGAMAGGMPWWKFAGNRTLTAIQNLLLGVRLSEFHTGYRAFSRRALLAVPFERNADGFVFDAQMLTQLVDRRMRIGEVACPSRYLDDSSSVGFWSSIRYGLGCIGAALRFRLYRWGLAGGAWLDADAPERRPLPTAVLLGLSFLCAWFAASRFIGGVGFGFATRPFDAAGYSDPLGLTRLVGFFGDAPRPWPLPLLYSLVGTDGQRVLLQVILSTAAWLFLAIVVVRRIRDRSIAIASALLILALGMTQQAVSWDRAIMPESLTITLAIAVSAAAIRWWERRDGVRTAVLAVLLLVLSFVRFGLIPVTAGFLVVAAALALRDRRRADIALAVTLVCTLAWVGLTIPRQSVTYEAFNQTRMGYRPPRYDIENVASVLHGRLLGDRDAYRWLQEHGMPPLEPDMDRTPSVGSDEAWGRFGAAVGRSQPWRQWLDARGGVQLLLRLPLAMPLVQGRLLLHDLPIILDSPWGWPHYVGTYGPPAPDVGIGVLLFFRQIGAVPAADLLALLVVALVAEVLRRRRGAPLGLVALAGWIVLIVGAGTLVVAWLLTGIEIVRHAVPAPLLLRIGAVLAALGSLDTLLPGTRRARE